jgi:hypothetical protein
MTFFSPPCSSPRPSAAVSDPRTGLSSTTSTSRSPNLHNYRRPYAARPRRTMYLSVACCAGSWRPAWACPTASWGRACRSASVPRHRRAGGRAASSPSRAQSGDGPASACARPCPGLMLLWSTLPTWPIVAMQVCAPGASRRWAGESWRSRPPWPAPGPNAACRAHHLPAPARVQFDVVNQRAQRDIRERQRVATRESPRPAH